MDLQKLTKELQQIILKEEFTEKLQKNPKLVMPIRLSLNLSQREFIKKVGISQATLINYEKGKSKRISEKKAEKIKKILSNHEISYDKIIKNYNKFQDMKKGKLMTSDRARELQKIWQKKTSKKQRSEWGSKGARITNKKIKHTEQEKLIVDLLNKNSINHKTHIDLTTDKLKINVDFVIFKEDKPHKIIEVTERKGNLYEYSLSYCYKSLLIKEKYPYIKTIFIGSNDISESSKRLLKNEFDHVIKISEIQKNLHLLQ